MRWGRAGIALVVAANIVFVAQMVRHGAAPKLDPPARKPQPQPQQQPAAPTSLSTLQPPRVDFRTSAANFTLRQTSCPIYSGPGYDKNRHPSRDTPLPAFEAPFTSTPRPPRLPLAPLPLADVALAAGTRWHAAFETNREFLRLVDTDALLLSWRLNAPGFRSAWKLSKLRLMGWEHTGSELRGHFLGHWLSATAMVVAVTGDAELRARMDSVVASLAEVAEAHRSGYLSAFPNTFLDRLEAVTPVWAPYYTLHKLLSGLLMQHTLRDGGSATALRLAEGLGTYVGGRVKALGVEKQFRTLAQECGGMNDALWSLSAVTGAAAHRETASLFDKPCLLGPLAMGKDALTGMHGATRPPSVSTTSTTPHHLHHHRRQHRARPAARRAASVRGDGRGDLRRPQRPFRAARPRLEDVCDGSEHAQRAVGSARAAGTHLEERRRALRPRRDLRHAQHGPSRVKVAAREQRRRGARGVY